MSASTVATPDEIAAALERWARGREIWVHGLENPKRDWWVARSVRGQYIVGRRGCDDARPDPQTVLAWALTLEAELPPVDMGRCPACEARGLPGKKLATMIWELSTQYRWEPFGQIRPPVGWLESGSGGQRLQGHRKVKLREWSGRKVWVSSRPCPACGGSGRELWDAARLVLAAEPGPSRFAVTINEIGDGGWRILSAGVSLFDPPVLAQPGGTVQGLLHLLAQRLQTSVEVFAHDAIGFFARAPVYVEGPADGSAAVVCLTPGESVPKAARAVAVLSDALMAGGAELGEQLATMQRLWSVGHLLEIRAAVEVLERAFYRSAVDALNRAFWDRQRLPFFSRGVVSMFNLPIGKPETWVAVAFDVLRTALGNAAYAECVGWAVESLVIERQQPRAPLMGLVGDFAHSGPDRSARFKVSFVRENYIRMAAEADAQRIVIEVDGELVERFMVHRAWVTERWDVEYHSGG